jgi:hypothetical protein
MYRREREVGGCPPKKHKKKQKRQCLTPDFTRGIRFFVFFCIFMVLSGILRIKDFWRKYSMKMLTERENWLIQIYKN